MTITVPSSTASSPVRLHHRQSSIERELRHNQIDPKMNKEAMDVDMTDYSALSSSDEADSSAGYSPTSRCGMGQGIWTKEEHTKFLEAIKIYANGPWKLVAAYVGTRTVRQTMTHAQKYRQKAARRLRGLRTKQALMRMHYGHRVSEESLLQERLRTFGNATNTIPAITEPVDINAATQSQLEHVECVDSQLSQPLTITVRADALLPHAIDSGLKSFAKTELDSITPTVSFTMQDSDLPTHTTESPVGADTDGSGMSFGELELLDDLSNSPTLEECADVLFELLF